LREAATVMLVRDDPGLQVFMLRRNLESVWVAGAYVFPGGAVDPDDRGEVLAARCLDLTDASASALLELPSGGLGYWVAAVRETFEEAGVLLARSRSTGRAVDPRVLAPLRDALNSGERTFTDIVVAEDLVLDTGALVAFSHWITPVGSPRRYDTRFFVTAAPEGHAYTPDQTETVASRWVRPADALAAADRGEMELILPTRRSLEALDNFATAEELLEAVRVEGAA
jgi:8-oxo-dGTP pyrophosphatase MutT (NUDIX family)